jgi:GMP synthase-like glutamine amidotransferase
MRIACLQHVPFEGPATIGAWAAAHHHPISIAHLFANEPLPALGGIDWLVILGGPMSVNDEAHFDWLRPEKDLIRHAIEKGKHVLGICLGAQLIAAALGARVYPASEREIGWFPVRRTPGPVRHPAFDSLPSTFTALHWHGETFDLPAGAACLARSQACMHQAFSLNPRVLGLQFHLESTPESVEALVQNCPADLAPGPFVQDAPALLSAHAHFRNANLLLATLLDKFCA